MAFLNRALSKEKMTRTRLRENVLEDGSEEKKMKYSKQCNYCVSILRKYKWNLFGSLKGTVMQIENTLINDRLSVSQLC